MVNGGKMKKIIIATYINKNPEAESKITIPFNIFTFARNLIPKEAISELEKEGIDLNKFFSNFDNSDFVGTLIEIEKEGKKIVVTIEDSEETQPRSVDKQIQVMPKTDLSE